MPQSEYERRIDERFILMVRKQMPEIGGCIDDFEAWNKIEAELQTSTALKLVLLAIEKEANEALEKLADVDPTDSKLITSLQAVVQRARIMGNTLEAIRRKGKFAEHSLREQSEIVLDQEEDASHG